jgi:hypothetical protein
MLRAARLGSLTERRCIALTLKALVSLAEDQRPASPYLSVRHRAVLGQREALLTLADRLAEPAPVEVSVVAELVQLLTDSSSPVYVGGTHPQRLGEVTTRCLQEIFGDDLAYG